MTPVGYANLCALLMDLATAIFWVGLPYLVIDWYHAQAWHLGLIAGLTWSTYMVTCVLAGRIAGRLARHHVMVAGALVVAGAVTLVWFSPSLWFVVGLAALCGLGQGLFWPVMEAFLSDGVGPTELRRRIGWFNLTWSSGDTLGCFLGGGLFGLSAWLAQRSGNRVLQAAPCLLAGAMIVGIAVLVLTRLQRMPVSESARDVRDEQIPRSPGRGGHASLGVFWLMALVASGASMALRATMVNIFPGFGKAVLGYSELSWGVLLGTTCLTRTIGFVYWQYRHAWEYRPGYLFGVQALLPLSALILVFNSNYWIFLVAFALAGVGISMTYYSSIFYSLDSEHSHEHRGGIHEAALGAGMMLPLFAGILASATGWVRSPYVFMFVLLLGGMGIQGVMYVRGRPAQP